MSRYLVVKNGTIVTPDAVYKADIGIINGRVAHIGLDLDTGDAEVIDAEDRLVLPGVIDAHVQLETLFGKTPMTDDFHTGTLAAAAGGVTTIIDFADQPRGVPALQFLRERKAAASAKVNVDYSLHMGITDLSLNTLDEIPRIINEEHIPSFKLYMAYSRGGRMVNDGEIHAVMSRVAQHGGIVGVHAESDSLVEYLGARLKEQGKTTPEHFPESRPWVAEAISIGCAVALAGATGCRLYVHHVSTRRGLEIISHARQQGIEVYSETCPQYLILTDEVYLQEDGFLYIMNPPLRTKEDTKRLWEGVLSGEVDVIGTDHCSYTREQKECQKGCFQRVPPGLPGVETLLPIVYSEGVCKGRIPVTRLVEVLCRNPARLFGLFPRKGSLNVGSDGDLVVFNPKVRTTLDYRSLKMRVDFSPYQGMELTGAVETTVLRGEVVYANGVNVGPLNRGIFVPGTLE